VLLNSTSEEQEGVDSVFEPAGCTVDEVGFGDEDKYDSEVDSRGEELKDLGLGEGVDGCIVRIDENFEEISKWVSHCGLSRGQGREFGLVWQRGKRRPHRIRVR
jgi:hypothetical protein